MPHPFYDKWMIPFWLAIFFQTMAAFFIGTIFFDFFHYLFHRCLESKLTFLRKIGHFHLIHHRFYTAELKVREKWAKKNLTYHVSLEYCIQMLGIGLCLLFFHLWAIIFAWFLQTFIFITVWIVKGEDAHHQSIHRLRAYRSGLFVDAAYHALHHLNPNYYFSSYVKVLDYFLGTAQVLKGKTIVMTGANGALGSQMKKRLEREGGEIIAFKFGTDYTYGRYEKLKSALEKADILLLCHGSKFENAQQANCDSFIDLIELFKKLCGNKKTPIEVWATGSEIECHPCFGIKKIKVYAASKRNFAKQARLYYRDPTIQYRHLVHSSFISQMGPGLMTASFAASVTLFLIKRGFKYIPVTYTGFAYLNYIRFKLNI